MSDRHKRLLIAASIALLAMGAVVLVTLAGRDEPGLTEVPVVIRDAHSGKPTERSRTSRHAEVGMR